MNLLEHQPLEHLALARGARPAEHDWGERKGQGLEVEALSELEPGGHEQTGYVLFEGAANVQSVLDLTELSLVVELFPVDALQVEVEIEQRAFLR